MIWKIRPPQPPWESYISHLDVFSNPTTRSIIYEHNITHAIKHIWMCLPFPIVGKCCPKLLSLNACFTYWWRCTRNFAKVHATHHVFKCKNMLHIQVPKVMISKLKCTVFLLQLHQICRVFSIHLLIVHFVQIVIPLKSFFHLDLFQYIHLGWIALSTHSTTTCSPRANLLATWRYEKHPWY